MDNKKECIIICKIKEKYQKKTNNKNEELEPLEIELKQKILNIYSNSKKKTAIK